MDFYEALSNRRSIYQLSNQSIVSDEKIVKLIEACLQYTPSAFHSQSQRVVVLFDQSHADLWDITLKSLKNIVLASDFSATESKMKGFKNAHGTILFFDDQETTLGLMKKFPLYENNFKLWYQQQNGMLQENVWVALSLEGLGASLQHYNELIEEEVKQVFHLPIHWQMIAQMPFGDILVKPEEKPNMPLNQRLIVLK